jgi:tetratricopeptide (TPR) repeat protein
MRRFKVLPAAALLTPLLFVVQAFTAQAQEATTGSIHGHITNTVGLPVTDGIVSLALAGAGEKEAKYTFHADANGDYKGTGIVPDTYTVILREPNTPPDKVVDQIMSVKIAAATDLLQDFDLSRADYIAKLTPEERKAAEETRAKNASALKDNAVIKNLNANLAKARQDINDKNYTEADSLMSQATQAKPDAAVLWMELGVAQNGEKKYDDAVTSLKKGLDANAASKKPDPAVEGGLQNELGRVYASQNKIPDSQAAFEAAAKADPTKAATYFGNEAIIMSQNGKTDETVAAADKAIAADPAKPIPYYLKGQALVSKATIDTKTQKIVAPPGCIESYEKYLELAPDGPMAPEVKAVLEGMGQTIKSSYKAKK